MLDDIPFDHPSRGEMLGIAGVEGNGQAELVEAIMGCGRSRPAPILLGDRRHHAVAHAATAGGGHRLHPGGPPRDGVLLRAPLWENRMLGHQTERPNVKGPWIDRRGARADTERIVRDYDVRTPGIDVLASALSGGNQQKLIVGREMSGEPKVLIAAQPTRGGRGGAGRGLGKRSGAPGAAGSRCC